MVRGLVCVVSAGRPMQRRLHDDKAAAITSVTSTVGASFGAE